MYHVVVSPPVKKGLKKLPKQTQAKMIQALKDLKLIPRPHGIVAIVGKPNTYRLRFGDYRLVYRVEDEQLIVLALGVGHRKDIYR